MGGRDDDSDQPLLNRRGEQLIGRMATLTEPIKDGRGRISSATRCGASPDPTCPPARRCA